MVHHEMHDGMALRWSMAPTLAPPQAGCAQRVPRVAGLISMVLGCMVLVGWVLDVQVLKTILPGFSSMKSNTAVGFVLLGVALAFSERSVARWASVGATVLRYKKPTFTKPAPVDLRHEIATHCQLVIEALAD